jgi:twitching motility protein PilT
MRLDREGLTQLLREALDAEASDIHLKANSRPSLRIGQDLVAMAHQAFQGSDTERAAGVLLRMADVDQPLSTLKETRFVMDAPTLGRLHVCIFRQRGELGIFLRPLPKNAPSLQALGAPVEEARTLEHPGIILVCGKRRQYLVSALVDGYNHSTNGHVMMLEAPILAFHQDVCAQVSQREIGRDTATWKIGISGALQQDVDVLVLNDQPGLDERTLLVRAAEEGCCVLLAVPAASPAHATEAFLEGFVGERRQRLEARLSAVLQVSMGLGRKGFERSNSVLQPFTVQRRVNQMAV